MDSAMKEEKKEKEKPKAIERIEKNEKVKKLYEYHVADVEHIEIKKLDEDDLEETLKIIQKSAVEVTSSVKGVVKDIINKGYSYGAFVDRVLVAVALAFPVGFDKENKEFYDDYENAVYIEDVFLLIAYEGKGIREKLVESVENEAKSRKMDYIVLITGEIPKGENLIDAIKERGTRLERALLKMDYHFARSKEGLLAFKILY